MPRQKLIGGRLADPEAPPLTYEAFVGLLLDWVTWWNTRHHPSALNGKTPVEAWQADATPLTGDVRAGGRRRYVHDHHRRPAQAEEELGAAAQMDRRALARPDLVPHGPAPDTWARPKRPRTPTPDEDQTDDR
ncbi:hypothetical protein ACFZBE_40175 [Streptomyces sp. NPDC008061]|uniref:hypothetical protein n=1 Tax=Streptomyces sp. NPDC008061 TaxID=3364805 RepID=UPI0036EB5AA2